MPEDVRYNLSADFWYILAARLIFVLVFQNVIAFVSNLIRWCIPDVPRKLSERIRQESYLTNEIIIKQEMIRARGNRDLAREDGTGRHHHESKPDLRPQSPITSVKSNNNLR